MNKKQPLNKEKTSDTLVLSLAVGGYQHWFHDCLKSHELYSQKHAYDYSVVTSAPHTLKAHDAAWLKVPLMISALNLGYKWIAFIDADCEIREFSDKIQSVEQPGKFLYFAPGISGRINSGVILLKNSEVVRSLLEEILNNADLEILPENQAPYENGHFIQYVQHNDSFGCLKHDTWNNNSELSSRSFIQHYSGKTMREYYIQNHVNLYNRFRKLTEVYWQKMFKPASKQFLNEASTLKRLNMLKAAYGLPLEGLIIHSMR